MVDPGRGRAEKEDDGEHKALAEKEPELRIELTDSSPPEDWVIAKFQARPPLRFSCRIG